MVSFGGFVLFWLREDVEAFQVKKYEYFWLATRHTVLKAPVDAPAIVIHIESACAGYLFCIKWHQDQDMGKTRLCRMDANTSLSKCITLAIYCCRTGGVLSYFKGLFGQKEIRILILGLDGNVSLHIYKQNAKKILLIVVRRKYHCHLLSLTFALAVQELEKLRSFIGCKSEKSSLPFLVRLLFNGLLNSFINWLISRFIDWLIDRLPCWLLDRFSHLPPDWLIDWLIAWTKLLDCLLWDAVVISKAQCRDSAPFIMLTVYGKIARSIKNWRL